MDWAGVGTVHGSQTLHAFSALVSFGSDDLNVSLPRSEQIRSLQAVCMDGRRDWRLASCRRLSSLSCCCCCSD